MCTVVKKTSEALCVNERSNARFTLSECRKFAKAANESLIKLKIPGGWGVHQIPSGMEIPEQWRGLN